MSFSNNRKYFFSRDSMFLLVGVLLFIFAGIINLNYEKPSIELTKQDTAINFDKNLLTYLSMGNKRLITDMIWIQTLLESDNERFKKKDTNNWMFLRFDTIAELDPHFYENYKYGGQFLSVIKDDLEGASIIFEKGLMKYPEDFWLRYYAGLMYYFEMDDSKRGLQHLEKVQHHPMAPSFIPSIINKLKFDLDQDLEIIYRMVEHNFNSTQDKFLKERLAKDLYAIKAELDLKCLNNRERNCSIYDQEGNPYIIRNNKYHTTKPFILYRIKKRGEHTLPPKPITTIN